MGIQIWRVTFGYDSAKCDMVAGDVEQAIRVAQNKFQKEIKDDPLEYAITKVEILAESDD
jgi:hypothetical protein